MAFWLFHIINYALACLCWLLIARMALSLIVPVNFNHYVWRNFVRLSDPFVKFTWMLTPALLRHKQLLLPIAFIWALGLRLGFALIMQKFMMLPTI